ncbi:ribonucleoside-triphosphate reductase, adenosylcobalamin-dependent, partial [Klebsiella pneumoniae]
MTENPIPWGPTGELVYERTYSRPKPDGTRETWPETVRRVVDGNLALAGKHERNERDELVSLMEEFKILPAGRHLWASGVPGRQYLFNCHVSGWGEDITEHFEFTFLRLMEGGGVGANYSNRFLNQYPLIKSAYTV